MSAVNITLTELLKKAPVLTGMKVVHWYDCDVPTQEDPFPFLMDTAFEMDESEEEEDAEEEAEAQQEKALNAELKFRALVEAVESGASVTPLDAQYHILMLSGAGGRVIVRRYERGTYGELVSALKQWEEELRLTNSNETGDLPSFKLRTRFFHLLKFQKEKNVFRKKSKKDPLEELSALGPAVLYAILNGKAPLPDSIAARALNHIRSRMMSAQEEDQQRDHLDPIAEQWLKAWLIRSRNKGGKIMSTYNPEYYELPYCCGAMVAVYGAVQKAAMPDVNASVIDRYYGSAIQTPGLVMGTLSQRAENHLRNLNSYDYKYYKNLLAEISSRIAGQHYPVTLNLEQQSEFSLGYYQMIARLNKESNERLEAWKAKKQAAEQKKEEQ